MITTFIIYQLDVLV